MAGELLEAPGVLENPIPVEALYSPHAAETVVLRNLLQRFGYSDLEAVRRRGHAEGRSQTLRDIVARQLARRFLGQVAEREALMASVSLEDLDWLVDAIWDAADLAELTDRLARRRA